MAYIKTNWVNNETPINATNLNKMEEGIEAANTEATTSTAGLMSASDKTKLNGIYANTYSTTETAIGTYNGATLYRKVISATTPTVSSNGNYANTQTTIGSNINYCWIESAYLVDSTGQHQPLPYINNSGYLIKCFVDSGKKLYLASNGTNYNGSNVIAICLYTKTS